MATNIELVQQLYVAYFNRPADVAGLNFWTAALDKGTTVDVIAAEFAKQNEYKALFAGKSADTVIDTVYVNMFGRHAEQAALDFYGPLVQNGTITIDKVVTDIVKGAQGTDGEAYANKVTAATTFTETLATAGNEADRVAYSSGDTSVLNLAKAWLATVTTDASLTTALANVETVADSLAGVGSVGTTYTLTTGIDSIVGGTGNDTINGSWATAAGKVLGGLDSIDGGAGSDTMNIDDTATGTGVSFSGGGATIKNVETVNIATTGTFGTAGTALSLTGITGATLNLKSQDAGAASHEVSVAGSDITNLTVTAGTVKINGGKAATVTGGTSATVTDNGAGTLTSVTLTKVGGTGTLTGDALVNVAVGANSVAGSQTVTVTNTTVDHTLNVTANGAGYIGSTQASLKVYDAAAKAIAITSTAKSALIVGDAATANTTLKTVTAAGAGNLKLDLDATHNTAVTSFDGSAATGNIALSNVAATTVSVKTGAGNDSFTTTQTAKSAFDTGAGSDTVTVATVLAAGTTIALGDGNDSLLFSTGGVVSNTSGTSVTVVDGGAGTDTLALALVGAANVGVFKNFEAFDVIGMSAGTLDMDILATNNTVTGISGSGALAGAVTLTNVGAGVGFTALADMGTAPALTLTQKTAGALTVTLDADNSDDSADYDASMGVVASNATSLKAVFNADSAFVNTSTDTNDNTIALTGSKATSLEIVSGGENANSNTLTYTSATNTSTSADYLTSVTASGAADLTFSYTPTTAAAISTFDASAMTGGLTISTSVLKNGGTIKLGSGTDSVTLTTASNAGTGAAEALSGFAKSTSATSATAIAAADHVGTGAAIAVVGTASSGTGYAVDAKGVVTFTGAGPTTLDGAIALAGTAAGAAAGGAVVFQYLNDSYIFVNGADAATAISATDFLVKLTGTTGITALVEDGTSNTLVIV